MIRSNFRFNASAELQHITFWVLKFCWIRVLKLISVPTTSSKFSFKTLVRKPNWNDLNDTSKEDKSFDVYEKLVEKVSNEKLPAKNANIENNDPKTRIP